VRVYCLVPWFTSLLSKDAHIVVKSGESWRCDRLGCGAGRASENAIASSAGIRAGASRSQWPASRGPAVSASLAKPGKLLQERRLRVSVQQPLPHAPGQVCVAPPAIAGWVAPHGDRYANDYYTTTQTDCSDCPACQPVYRLVPRDAGWLLERQCLPPSRGPRGQAPVEMEIAKGIHAARASRRWWRCGWSWCRQAT
jgi:hypothetical protein